MSSAFIQLRSEENGLIFVPSLRVAMDRAKKDPTIWKISWTDAITKERVRLVRQANPFGDIWVYEPLLGFEVTGLEDVSSERQ